MDRIGRIQMHPVFQRELALLQEAEAERIFCRHTISHFLDVARLMYIWNLEDHAGLDREVIYAAALLHDIGRYQQETTGISHSVEGAGLAGTILAECDYSPDEIKTIQSAILSHRSDEDADSAVLNCYLYRADKLSRNCFSCPAKPQCYWPDSKKNQYITY